MTAWLKDAAKIQQHWAYERLTLMKLNSIMYILYIFNYRYIFTPFMWAFISPFPFFFNHGFKSKCWAEIQLFFFSLIISVISPVYWMVFKPVKENDMSCIANNIKACRARPCLSQHWKTDVADSRGNSELISALLLKPETERRWLMSVSGAPHGARMESSLMVFMTHSNISMKVQLHLAAPLLLSYLEMMTEFHTCRVK